MLNVLSNQKQQKKGVQGHLTNFYKTKKSSLKSYNKKETI